MTSPFKRFQSSSSPHKDLTQSRSFESESQYLFEKVNEPIRSPIDVSALQRQQSTNSNRDSYSSASQYSQSKYGSPIPSQALRYQASPATEIYSPINMTASAPIRRKYALEYIGVSEISVDLIDKLRLILGKYVNQTLAK